MVPRDLLREALFKPSITLPRQGVSSPVIRGKSLTARGSSVSPSIIRRFTEPTLTLMQASFCMYEGHQTSQVIAAGTLKTPEGTRTI